MKTVKMSVPQGVFLAVFALSGFAGLIYESIWSHYLKLFLGHAAYAQALVLVIFMGGMAGGAALASRYSLKIKHALIGYAVVEGLIGLTALVFHTIFTHSTNWAYDSVLPNLGSPVSIELFKWTLAALLILPQSLMLGATFPLMSAGLIRRSPGKAGYNLAMLYFTNSLGAALGVLASGFVLISWVGLPGTLLTAGLVNVVLALLVWTLVHDGAQELQASDLPKVYAGMREAEGSRLLVLVLLSSAFITSAASFFYEIGWIRMLSLVLGSATHSFELMLSSFVLGLALGGLLISRKIDHLKRPLLVLAAIQIVMGVLAALTVPLYASTFDAMAWGLNALDRTPEGFSLFTGFKYLIAMVVMLPATIMAGMTLPIITHVLLKSGQGERAIGQVYAINTVGAIVGVALASLMIMPMLGLRSVLLLGALADIGVGIGLLWLLRRESAMGGSNIRPYILAAVALLMVGGVTLLAPFSPVLMSSGVFRVGALGLHDLETSVTIDHFDGATATISTYKSDKSGSMVTIATNGKPDASVSTTDDATQDELTMVFTALLPLATHQSAKEIAVIGFGSGYTGHALLGDADLTRVDTIEIEPKMVEGARNAYRSLLPRVFNDPRSHVFINDAKTFFAAHQSQYDVIVAEPSNPWVSGVSSLFSREFYSRVKRYLRPDGVYVQWLQGYEISLPLVSTVFAALLMEFDDVQLFALGNGDFMLLAKPKGHLPALGERPFLASDLKATLDRVGLTSLPELEMRRVAGRESLLMLARALRSDPNSDYFPKLDLGAEKTRFMREEVAELLRLRTDGFLLGELLDGFKPLNGLVISEKDRTPLGGIARRALGYTAVMQNWAKGSDALPFQQVSGLNLENYRTINYLLSDASCDQQTAVLWLRDLHSIIRTTLPFVDVGAIGAPMDKLAQHKCLSYLPSDSAVWMSFYKAMNARDFEQMVKDSELLLASGDVPASDKRWLAFNAALAAFALRDPVAVRTVWGAYRHKSADVEVERRILDSLFNPTK